MYLVLAPGVYLTILLVGVTLTWPQETAIGRWLVARSASWRRTTDRLSGDPAFRTMCAIAGLIAMTLIALVITFWLARAKSRGVQGATLGQIGNDPGATIVLVVMGVGGLIAGSAWVGGMRRATTLLSSLGVLTASMALTGLALFFYVDEVGLHDMLLVLAQGTMLGALLAAASHPLLLGEGLFAELFVPRAE
jgi:hypothetical protein